MTSAARPGGECWREAAEAEPRGFPGVSSVSGDQRREDIRGYQDPDSDQSRHLLSTQSGEILRESVKLQSGSHLKVE